MKPELSEAQKEYLRLLLQQEETAEGLLTIVLPQYEKLVREYLESLT